MPAACVTAGAAEGTAEAARSESTDETGFMPASSGEAGEDADLSVTAVDPEAETH